MRLETERLILRPPVTSDADAYCNICNSVFVLRYNAMTPKSKEAIADHFLGTCDDTWIIEEKKSGKAKGYHQIYRDGYLRLRFFGFGLLGTKDPLRLQTGRELL